MNVNQLIKTSLAPLNIPMAADASEEASEYITFNYADERPVMHADDVDVFDSTIVQVHHFTKGNPQATKKAIRRYLRAGGFTILSTNEFYEDDTGLNHVVVEAAILGEIDD